MPELRGIEDPDVTTTDDTLTLTIRLHDPKEKTDPKKSAQWATVKVSRGDLGLPKNQFVEKYVEPALGEIKNLTGS